MPLMSWNRMCKYKNNINMFGWDDKYESIGKYIGGKFLFLQKKIPS